MALAKWALAEGRPRDDGGNEDPFTLAHAEQGHLELVVSLIGEGGFALNKWVCCERHHLELVQWATASGCGPSIVQHEGCEWDEDTCAGAASGGLQVLQWLRTNGCPLGARTPASTLLGNETTWRRCAGPARTTGARRPVTVQLRVGS